MKIASAFEGLVDIFASISSFMVIGIILSIPIAISLTVIQLVYGKTSINNSLRNNY